MAYTTDECVWVLFDDQLGSDIFEDGHENCIDQKFYFSPIPLDVEYFADPNETPYPSRRAVYPRLKPGFHFIDTYALFIPKQHIITSIVNSYVDSYRFVVCRWPLGISEYNNLQIVVPSDPRYHEIHPITRVRFDLNWYSSK